MKESIELMQIVLKKEIPDLNKGGCIHFAYYFTNVLKKLNIPYKVYGFNTIKIGKTYNTFEAVDHIVVYLDGIGYLDGHKFLSKNPYRYQRHIKLKNLDKLRSSYYNWNYEYDIRLNPKLEKIINKYINDN